MERRNKGRRAVMVNVTRICAKYQKKKRKSWRIYCSISEEQGEELKKGYPKSEIERILHEDYMKSLI